MENLDELGIDMIPGSELLILASRRGSVAKLLTVTGFVLVKLADLKAIPTERDIVPSRSVGIRNEATALRRLKGRHGPRVIAYSETENFVSLTTEYIRGTTISMAAHEDPSQRGNLVQSLLNRVQALHADGILHGDLQPDNVMVNNEKALRLIDFEFSHKIHEPSQTPGLRTYLSPEASQSLLDGVIPPLDQPEETFALTASCLSLLTSTHPGDFKNRKRTNDDEIDTILATHRYTTIGAPESYMNLAQQLVGILNAPQGDRPSSPDELIEALQGQSLTEAGY